MLLKSNPSNSNIDYPEALVIHLLATGQYAQAYQLLYAAKGKDSVAVLFNLALCYLSVGNKNSCLQNLDQANGLLRIPLSASSSLNDADFRAMTVQQNKGNSYQSPLTVSFVETFPEIVRDNILRLKVDCFLMLEQWPQVLNTAALLQNKQYKNVDDAVGIARNNEKLLNKRNIKQSSCLCHRLLPV